MATRHSQREQALAKDALGVFFAGIAELILSGTDQLLTR